MNNEGRFIWNIFRLTWSLGTLFFSSLIQLFQIIIKYHDPRRLFYFVIDLLHQDELLVLSISFSLIDDKLLAKRLYFPFDCNIYVFRVFQISLLQIVLSKDRYWTHQYCLALLSIWTQLCLWVWIYPRKYLNVMILMWDHNVGTLSKMPSP